MAEGDPRVHFVMNLALSALYASVILWGMDFLGVAEFTLRNAALGTAVIFGLTYVVVLR